MADYQHLTHKFEPVFNQDSRILILGTFPSVKSRENQFFYSHPQNRFWKVLAAITKEPVPVDIPEKKRLLLVHRIAVWDVIKSCEIIGSSDSSIRNVIPADIPGLLEQTSISAIFGNGNKTCELFEKYTRPMLLENFSRNPPSRSDCRPAGRMAIPAMEVEDFHKNSPSCSIHKLPSTSPANAAWSLERLVDCWGQEILPFL